MKTIQFAGHIIAGLLIGGFFAWAFLGILRLLGIITL